MANNYGPGISRVLDVTARNFQTVVFQQGKPPMDAEFVLATDLATELNRQALLRSVPSGWLGQETNLGADYQTDPTWSNWFRFGTQRTGEKQSVMWAVVNGWVVPVLGTRTGTPPGLPNDQDTTNIIALDPPPASDARTDFVFLEVWLARVAPNPSTANKPSASALYRYGNVEGGASYLPDDLIDPALGFETSQRVQLQYRIRVVKGQPTLNLAAYPDGFDPAVVKAKGAYDPLNPDTQTAWVFENMRKELGDPGLWRAGDGTANNLGTVDGYVYAIPLCGVFRRNSSVWLGDTVSGVNLNGSLNRNPTAVSRTGVKTFSTMPVLGAALSSTATSLTLASAVNVPLPANPANPVYIQIGDEILTYTSLVGNTLSGLTRGPTVGGTVAETHPIGAPVKVLSGRPDGLFADQVAKTDILDLRHVVNPNGFDYDTLLRYNFDKLLCGELRSNWKRSGGQTAGTFVAYQDKVSALPAYHTGGATKLDGPDGHRTVWSDAITVEPVELVLEANTNVAPAVVNVAWDLALQANRVAPTSKGTANFEVGDVFSIPISQMKSGLPGADLDQVRWCHEGDWLVELRLDGDTHPLDPSTFTVGPTTLTSSDDLLITLTSSFPTTTRRLFVKAYVLYGAGRGLSRLPDAIHEVALYGAPQNVLHRSTNYPALQYRMGTTVTTFWSKYAPPGSGGNSPYMPVTTESYVDPGSKTLVVQPFRRVEWGALISTQDGTAANLTLTPVVGRITGVTSVTRTFTDPGDPAPFTGVTPGMALVVRGGKHPGRYTIVTATPTALTVERDFLVAETDVEYMVYPAQGLMPLLKRDGVTPKWTTTDPLGLFSGSTESTASTKNLYVSLPSHLVPYGGAVHVPVVPLNTTVGTIFQEGVNFMFLSGKGASVGLDNKERNYVAYQNGGFSYAVLSTLNLNPPYLPATYNAIFTKDGNNIAGIRKFQDPRPLGRQGLEFPPFYGIARLFGVYEATDYRVNGSPYDATTREYLGLTGNATNLLRQDLDGPVFWLEVDEDGDATFVLNAEALDLSRSPNPIASFASGDFVVEANLFGFDRDTFSQDQEGTREVRLVLSRNRTEAINPVRDINVTANIAGPRCVLPGPMPSDGTVMVSYSRTPYGGDAWGTQTAHTDIGYTPGPLLTGAAYQLATTRVDSRNLSRPNPKVFEVLASLVFSTTAGTGRISSSLRVSPIGDPGYEDTQGYPPSSPVSPRPNFFTGGLTGAPEDIYASRYNGCIERLPLGALYRDKDYRAIFFAGRPGHTLKGEPESVGFFAGFSQVTNLEAKNLVTFADSSVEPGALVVHIDGSAATSGLPVTNFRTNRGGSGYMVSGDNPGGAFASGYVGLATPHNDRTNVLSGVAMLVRNYPTVTGSLEASAGGEIMLLVATQHQIVAGRTSPQPLFVLFSSTGMGEGRAAMDYYRIEGHPLVRDYAQVRVDPLVPLAPLFGD